MSVPYFMLDRLNYQCISDAVKMTFLEHCALTRMNTVFEPAHKILVLVT